MSREPAGRKRPLWVPLSAIVVGAMLFLFAASGGFALGGLSLRLETSGAQLLLSAIGLVLMAGGVLLLADERSGAVDMPKRTSKTSMAECEIKMLRPARFQRQMKIEGGYLNQPPDRALRLFTVTEDGRFRPQSIVTFDKQRRRWSGEIDLGPGTYYSVYVVAALVDAPGIVLWDYFYQVGDKTEWAPVAGGFREYAAECDRFLVEGMINE